MLIIFYIFAALSILGGLGVLFLRNPIHCALSLVGTFFCLGSIYVMLNAEFVAVIQVLVYAGAIMVLFLFVLMLLSSKTSDQNTNKWPIGKILAGLLSFGIFVKIASLFSMGDLQLGPKGAYPLEVVEEVGSISLIGRLLFTDYILSFEIIAILLLVAVIGAVVIAKRRFH
ncbi:MAG: NADH-quinone oxidoreductase subunit J [SAR324 cluster bacterium]|jgi:NADH-quinone oxidoreductase subunit J|nr:NADH-quinone oxidoreductase subunit J [SAR324 cluster bacterium]PQM55686.1 MAG: NADH-quinone oxidoreductase subunit J [Deltaproteobacteria bacterium]MDP6319503.1 NADH-quinone oxidoreductase subunit J [SAR324 cluster bacterium]MDP6331678.1 NADH-quinone oxidoreductase subunit J [SAR324 cluster bacterium]MDP6888163.1 NADH-quinone oxidoreductase subunit J [SAR324 cluster bacterium]|tara:strand:+ start:281 stop:793 length:513 start_codon:yes stop_codon:yes gene_type:complete